MSMFNFSGNLKTSILTQLNAKRQGHFFLSGIAGFGVQAAWQFLGLDSSLNVHLNIGGKLCIVHHSSIEGLAYLGPKPPAEQVAPTSGMMYPQQQNSWGEWT